MKNIPKIINLFFQENPNMFWYLVSIYYPFSNTELAIFRDHAYWGWAVFGETSVGLHDSIDIGLNCNNNLVESEFAYDCFEKSIWKDGIIPGDFYSGTGSYDTSQYIHTEVCRRLPLDPEGGPQNIDGAHYDQISSEVEKEYHDKLVVDGTEGIFQILHLLQQEIEKIKRLKSDNNQHDSEYILRQFLLFNPLIWKKHFAKIIDQKFMKNAGLIEPSWLPKDILPF